ncbi:MAG: hypothetical protein LV473_14770 [Nitrospira sp.]|nr:hypothetical protein [Nitrospira sp.]
MAFKLPSIPSPRAGVHELADFAEILCWNTGSTSRREILADLGRVEENENNVGCDDVDDENSDVLDEVMIEIERRQAACGIGYPFKLDLAGTVLTYDPSPDKARASLYQYLLLSTRINMRTHRMRGGIDGTFLLEEVSAHAVKNYLGANRARSLVFGTSMPGTFEHKVQTLCNEIREGTGFRTLDPAAVQANDDKLDAVAWIPFSDLLPGQIIVFCQCKTGTSWESLTSQLYPDVFIKKWMSTPVLITPIRAFCISEATDRSRWNGLCLGAGVLFDRCRLVDFSDNLSADLLDRIERWTKSASELMQ